MRLRWLLMVVLLSLSASAAACPVEPEFSIAASLESDGDTLVVALTNITNAPVHVSVREQGAETRLEMLRVSFAQADVVYARLEDWSDALANRPRGTLRVQSVAPGETLVARLDLEWRLANLHCGVFDVHVDHFGGTTLPAQVIERPGCEWMPATVGPQPKWFDGSEPTRWPVEILLAGSLLVGAWRAKRAGTPDRCVPCSLP